jgi:hypothetical protein
VSAFTLVFIECYSRINRQGRQTLPEAEGQALFLLGRKKTTPVRLRTGAVEIVHIMWYNKDKKKILAGQQEFRFSSIHFLIIV